MESDEEDVFIVKSLKRMKTSRSCKINASLESERRTRTISIHSDHRPTVNIKSIKTSNTKTKNGITKRKTIESDTSKRGKVKNQPKAKLLEVNKGCQVVAESVVQQTSWETITCDEKTACRPVLDLTQDDSLSCCKKEIQSLNQSKCSLLSISNNVNSHSLIACVQTKSQTDSEPDKLCPDTATASIPHSSQKSAINIYKQPPQISKSGKRLSFLHNTNSVDPTTFRGSSQKSSQSTSTTSRPTLDEVVASNSLSTMQNIMTTVNANNLKSEGRCPFCQVPFQALSGQLPDFHSMECMDIPLKTTEECPDGLACYSTVSSHYRRYGHSMIAHYLAENQDSTGTTETNTTECHQDHDAYFTEQNQALHNKPDDQKLLQTSPLRKPKKRNINSHNHESQRNIHGSPNKHRKRYRRSSSQQSTLRQSSSQQSSSISSQKDSGSNSNIKDYFSPSPCKSTKAPSGTSCTSTTIKKRSDASKTKLSVTDGLPLTSDFFIMSVSESEDDDGLYNAGKTDDSDVTEKKSTIKTVASLPKELNAACFVGDETMDVGDGCHSEFGESCDGELEQQKTEQEAVSEPETEGCILDLDGDENEEGAVSHTTCSESEVSAATNSNASVNPLLQKQTSLFSYFAPHCHSSSTSNVGQIKKGRGSTGKKPTPVKPSSRKSGTFTRVNNFAQKPSLGTRSVKSPLVQSTSEPVIIRVPSPPPVHLDKGSESEHSSKPANRSNKASSWLSSAFGVVKNAAGLSSNSKPQAWRGGNEKSGSSKGHRGAVRQCPFYKRLPGTAITVDAFSFGVIPGCQAYVLTHFHSDHYHGLSRKFSQPIYCSLITANLVEKQLGVSSHWINRLPMNTPVQVTGVWLTLMEANHCPGAVIILFELPNGKKLLHTGDFRACPGMEQYPPLMDVAVDELYLDTTYCDPAYAFPSQKDAIDFAVSTTLKTVEQNPNTLVVCGAYTIGKERIFIALADALQSKVCVQPTKKRVLDCLDDAKLKDRVSLKWSEGRVHVLPMGKLNTKSLEEHLEQCPQFTSVLAFEPTGWTHSNKSLSLDTLRPKFSRRQITVYGVPYSEHSSYLEMKRFVQFLRPKKILPTVNNGSATSRKKMEDIFKQWLSELPSGYQASNTTPAQQQSLGAWLGK